MRLIRNHRQLIENSLCLPDRQARDVALEVLEAGIKSVLPKTTVPNIIHIAKNILSIQGQKFDLDAFEHIWLLGAGKASGDMAREFEQLLGQRIIGGCIVCDQPVHLDKCELVIGGHPIPDQKSIEGGKKLQTIARLAGEKDLVICLVSGGGSALVECLVDPVDLAELSCINQALLNCGASIEEVNTVRICLSTIKGGGLLLSALPATLIGLIVSDVVGNKLRYIASGPTVFEPKDFAAAMKILMQYGIWDSLAEKTCEYFRQGIKESQAMLSDKIRLNRDKVHNFLIASSVDAKEAMYGKLEQLGYEVVFCDMQMQASVRSVADRLVRILDQHRTEGKCAVLFFGETRVEVKGNGQGGRNQELVLACVEDLAQLGEGCVIAAMGSDGIDFAKVAGAIADSSTLARGTHMNIEPSPFLVDNDSYHFFEALEDHIVTGCTGTNIGDIIVAVSLEQFFQY